MVERYRILMSKRAATDLESIFARIARDSHNNAAGFVERMLKAIEALEVFPHRQVVEQSASGLKNPVRSLPVDSYIIFFRVLDAQRAVRILRVRHGARRRLRRFE